MENPVAKRVKDTFQRLRSSLLALKNTLVQRLQNAEEKPKASSSSRSRKASHKK